MIPNLPLYIPVTFGLIVLLTLWLFYGIIRNASRAAVRGRATGVLIGLSLWLLVQAVLTLTGVYNSATPALPPRIVLFGILPSVLTIVLVFTTRAGRRFADSLPLARSTYLNTVRVGVEVVLYWLFVHKAVPQLMTFDGRNYDILAGLTAPAIAYFGLTKGMLSRRVVLLWNVLSLALLLNIVVNALLSAPTPVQQFAFDQPNIALAHFPFSWLPTFVVPVVLFGHLMAIRQLIKQPSAIHGDAIPAQP